MSMPLASAAATAEDPDVDAVDLALIARFAARLGLEPAAAGPDDLDLLTTVYRAWCDAVPFDNIRKRIFQAAGAQGPVPGDSATAFIEGYLDGGSGGTCWATSSGLVALLRAYGFHASVKPAVMMTDPEVQPNHASVAVELATRGHFVLDTSILHDAPLAIPATGDTIRTGSALHPIVISRPVDDYCEIEWVPAHARDLTITTRIHRGDITGTDLRRWHDATRARSLFNQSLYVRRNRADGIDVFGRGKHIVVDVEGRSVSRRVESADTPALLADVFGLDAALIARIPADDPGDAFL